MNKILWSIALIALTLNAFFIYYLERYVENIVTLMLLSQILIIATALISINTIFLMGIFKSRRNVNVLIFLFIEFTILFFVNIYFLGSYAVGLGV